jgi:LiaF transmembrane domain
MESSDRHYADPGRVAWGSVLIVFGLLLLAERLGYLDFGGQFWPFILIALGAARLAERPAAGHRRSGQWLIFVGAWGLINEMHLFGLSYQTSWPLMVIAAGAVIVWRALHRHDACGRVPNGGNHAA